MGQRVSTSNSQLNVDPSRLDDRSKWSCQPAALHHNHGSNIKLSDNDSVAERVRSYDYGIVFTAEPVPLNCAFQVTVLREEDWTGSFVSASTVITSHFFMLVVFTASMIACINVHFFILTDNGIHYCESYICNSGVWCCNLFRPILL